VCLRVEEMLLCRERWKNDVSVREEFEDEMQRLGWEEVLRFLRCLGKREARREA
jgi:hypothetical protein